jgi:polysaccharide biosynthesis protein VpsJ
MGIMMASPGKTQTNRKSAEQALISDSIDRLSTWLEGNDYRAYDTFDGLNARFIRPLTFEKKFLRQVLQQGVRRFPINLRPVLGIAKARSTKGMGFLARGFMRMHRTTGDRRWAEKAIMALQWLTEHQAQGYSGAAWGNHFDYQSRSNYLPKGVPTIVWTSLVGHAFIDAFEHFQDEKYLKVAQSACEHIMQDLQTFPDGDELCITYIPGKVERVHNANVLGAGLLARTFSYTRNQAYVERATKAIGYTAKYQKPDGSWFYGEKANLHWIDNFHTAYVLDSIKHYSDSTDDRQFDAVLKRGYDFWKGTFFLEDGTPRYYDRKTLPIDIQCSSQAIDTLVFFRALDPESLPQALKVAKWTIDHMQDPSGYFYYRRYNSWLVNKTPTMHWGEATMLCALAGLLEALETRDQDA